MRTCVELHMRQVHTNIHHACNYNYIYTQIYAYMCMHIRHVPTRRRFFLWVKHAFPRAAGICWTRIIEWECQGRTRISFFPRLIQSLDYIGLPLISHSSSGWSRKIIPGFLPSAEPKRVSFQRVGPVKYKRGSQQQRFGF